MPTTFKQPTNTTIERRNLKNNDPLAHVDLIVDGRELGAAEEYRTYVEYVTDMGERLAQPFRKTFEYITKGDDFVSDTGIHYLQFLENGYRAAINDVAQGHFDSYHAARAEAFYNQHPQIRAWAADGNDESFRMYASLCPPETELPFKEAKKQSFKPERLMASIQLYEKTANGIRLHAFSLDGLSLERLGELFVALGVKEVPAATTLEQLTKPFTINATMPAGRVVDSIIYHYDALLTEKTGTGHNQGLDEQKFRSEANSFVESKPETYEMYKQTVIEVARSLQTNRVTPKLSAIIGKLQDSILAQNAAVPNWLNLSVGQYIDRASAGNVIDYLRTRAIPHYLTNQLHNRTSTNPDTYRDSGGYQDISDAGGQATAQNKSYEGDCPTSLSASPAQDELFALGQVFNTLSAQSREDWQWTTGKCIVDNCPSRPSKTEVGPCSVCRDCQDIFDDGKDPLKIYGKKEKTLTEIFEDFFSSILESDKEDLDVAA